ncbi:MAG: CU044_2847 family protein [Ktedonobacteraceae bacterium]
MKHFVEYPLEDGSNVIIEIDEPASEETQYASRGEEILVKAKGTLENALEKVLPAAKAVVEKVKSIETDADEVEVTFGIQLNSTFSALISSVSAEANFGVTLRWHNEKKQPTP